MLRKWTICAYDRRGFGLISYEFYSWIPFWVMKIIVDFCKVDISYYSEIKLLILSQSREGIEKEIEIYRHPGYKD